MHLSREKYRHDNRKNPYLGDILRCNWQEVDFIRKPFGGLDSGNVGVDQHSLDVLFLQSLNSLVNKAEFVQMDDGK